MQTTTISSAQHALEFGIYRDGDNNLDASQEAVLGQALKVSKGDPSVGFTIEDTTSLKAAHGDIVKGDLHTDNFTIADGKIGQAQIDAPHDMSSPSNLAQFVAHALDEAQKSGAKQTWIDLVDHGAGDGGGLEADSTHGVMPMPKIAQAIADGAALHSKEHPEDAGRGVDGVVANQCLMDTLGFADALSGAGVKYLAASPETMISPGAPTSVAHAIAANIDDPRAMGKAVVKDVMGTTYDGGIERYSGAAAFDVLDLDPKKLDMVRGSVKSLNDALAGAAHDPAMRGAIRQDVRSIDGMTRDPELAAQHLPWQADRPAIAAYDTIARDARLSSDVRAKAAVASKSVGDIVLAHRESHGFAPFNSADYSDAAGPTAHLPVTPKQVDPWAPAISETDNRFYQETDAADLTNALA
jgi:hypothetical protein